MAVQITPILNQLKTRVGNEGFDKPRALEFDQAEEKTFSDMVKDAVESVDQAQKTADLNIENIVTGKSDNIHEAMISMEKAQLSFQLMMEIRNKTVETYQELSRMQI